MNPITYFGISEHFLFKNILKENAKNKEAFKWIIEIENTKTLVSGQGLSYYYSSIRFLNNELEPIELNLNEVKLEVSEINEAFDGKHYYVFIAPVVKDKFSRRRIVKLHHRNDNTYYEGIRSIVKLLKIMTHLSFCDSWKNFDYWNSFLLETMIRLSKENKLKGGELKTYFGVTDDIDLAILQGDIYQEKYAQITNDEEWISPLLKREVDVINPNSFFELIDL